MPYILTTVEKDDKGCLADFVARPAPESDVRSVNGDDVDPFRLLDIEID
jgi:hypothetical protein